MAQVIERDYLAAEDAKHAGQMRLASGEMHVALWREHPAIMNVLRAAPVTEPRRPGHGPGVIAFPPRPKQGRFAAKGPLWPRWYNPPQVFPPTVKDILRAVARDFQITLSELKGERRSVELVDARSVAVRLLRDRGLSYPQIGTAIGGRDHSTIINAVKRFETFVHRNPKVLKSYRKQRERLAFDA